MSNRIRCKLNRWVMPEVCAPDRCEMWTVCHMPRDTDRRAGVNSKLPKTVDPKKVIEMRKTMTLEAVAFHLDCSTHTVRRVINTWHKQREEA